MQWSRNMVHSHFTLGLRVRDYLKRLSQHPWYGLWMRVKGPHHYKVMALGFCVKWPLELSKSNPKIFHKKISDYFACIIYGLFNPCGYFNHGFFWTPNLCSWSILIAMTICTHAEYSKVWWVIISHQLIIQLINWTLKCSCSLKWAIT